MERLTDWPPVNLIRLRPRSDALYVTQNRTVLITARDGFISSGSEQGLFVHETRLLSCYRYLINGRPPLPVTLSNVEQHSWLGYYIQQSPGIDRGNDTGSGQVSEASQQTLELRISRYVGPGVHEDIDLTNFTQKSSALRLELEVDADFADTEEAGRIRQQFGEITRE